MIHYKMMMATAVKFCERLIFFCSVRVRSEQPKHAIEIRSIYLNAPCDGYEKKTAMNTGAAACRTEVISKRLNGKDLFLAAAISAGDPEGEPAELTTIYIHYALLALCHPYATPSRIS